ncbi:MAG: hypothetical protein JST58_01805 [Bacteroidetes bacterium]|nr:hypothetical protein [Bacteroidota bacterium]
MQTQNYKNHRRVVPLFHMVTSLAIMLLLVGSFVNLFHSAHENLYSASLICLIAVILGLFFWFIRSFPIKAQDRAIRAEENLRYFALTGKLLDPKLTISQIIALRFASDEELAVLAKKAVDEGLSNDQIKKQIINWRADHHRA